MSYKYYNRNRFIKPKKTVSGADQIERRILASEILGTLEDNNFSRCKRLETKFGDNSEVVYAKPLKENNRYIIAVYTSCNQLGGAFIAKPKGKDAIRVAGLYIKKDGKTVGILKNTRVNRTSSSIEICKRMIERISKSTIELRKNINCDKSNCNKCGSPLFLSKKGNLVCAELCWRK